MTLILSNLVLKWLVTLFFESSGSTVGSTVGNSVVESSVVTVGDSNFESSSFKVVVTLFLSHLVLTLVLKLW